VRINNTRVENNQGIITLYVYVNDLQTEFSQELGTKKDMPIPLKDEIYKVIKSKYPDLKINAVKIVVGTIIVTGFPFQQLQAKAATTATTVTQSQSQPNYQVQSGDTLYRIATRFDTTLEKIKTINQLKTDYLNVGQILTLPGSTYIVIPGDTWATAGDSKSS
jgi:LysM repeat protein